MEFEQFLDQRLEGCERSAMVDLCCLFQKFTQEHQFLTTIYIIQADDSFPWTFVSNKRFNWMIFHLYTTILLDDISSLYKKDFIVWYFQSIMRLCKLLVLVCFSAWDLSMAIYRVLHLWRWWSLNATIFMLSDMEYGTNAKLYY